MTADDHPVRLLLRRDDDGPALIVVAQQQDGTETRNVWLGTMSADDCVRTAGAFLRAALGGDVVKVMLDAAGVGVEGAPVEVADDRQLDAAWAALQMLAPPAEDEREGTTGGDD